MISYRLYSLKDGRILSTVLFEAKDDVAAIEKAHARKSPVDGELWCDSRLVAFIPAVGTGPEDG